MTWADDGFRNRRFENRGGYNTPKPNTWRYFDESQYPNKCVNFGTCGTKIEQGQPMYYNGAQDVKKKVRCVKCHEATTATPAPVAEPTAETPSWKPQDRATDILKRKDGETRAEHLQRLTLAICVECMHIAGDGPNLDRTKHAELLNLLLRAQGALFQEWVPNDTAPALPVTGDAKTALENILKA